MRVGVGLPSSISGTSSDRLIQWAKHAEELEFSTLGVVDRFPYFCFEPLTLLSTVAAATHRIGVATVILIAPLRNAAVLAGAASTLHAISGGRLTLGVSVGARQGDYESAGADHTGRGERLTDQLGDVHSLWAVRDVRPTLLVGGASDLAFRRMANLADGYVHGGGPPRAFERAALSARTAWADADRPGKPLLWGQGYFALGDAAEAGRAYMRDYYAFVGPFAERIAEALLTTPQDVVQFVRGYSEAGCDELILMPATADLDQLDRLAEVIAGAR
jgi:alkanesulfonate monooxygenase SsuD/methylene tetrahydromethanopterin reductase-like flavin-dependent oxidoreductase (luciferase family)